VRQVCAASVRPQHAAYTAVSLSVHNFETYQATGKLSQGLYCHCHYEGVNKPEHDSAEAMGVPTSAFSRLRLLLLAGRACCQ
jgi:hypothetical protein